MAKKQARRPAQPTGGLDAEPALEKLENASEEPTADDRLRQGSSDRPVCAICTKEQGRVVFMVATSSPKRPPITYYKCPTEGCTNTDQRIKPSAAKRLRRELEGDDLAAR